MNCREALRLLYDYVDKEAEKIDVAEVEKHLHKCRHCMARYEFEQMFKTFVIEKGSHEGDSSQIKDQIMAQLDAIDAAGEVGTPPRPFKRWAIMAAAAAALLVVCILGAFTVGDYFRAQREFVPFATAHFSHASDMSVVSAGINPFIYLYEQTGIRLNESALKEIGTVRAVSVDTIRGVKFGHLELSSVGSTDVSLFVTKAKDYQLPSRPIEVVDGREVVVHRCDYCTLIGLSRDNLIFFVVSKPDHQPEQLTHLAAAF